MTGWSLAVKVMVTGGRTLVTVTVTVDPPAIGETPVNNAELVKDDKVSVARVDEDEKNVVAKVSVVELEMSVDCVAVTIEVSEGDGAYAVDVTTATPESVLDAPVSVVSVPRSLGTENAGLTTSVLVSIMLVLERGGMAAPVSIVVVGTGIPLVKVSPVLYTSVFVSAGGICAE